MNYCSVLIFFLFGVVYCQQAQFVTMLEDNMKINKYGDVIAISIQFEILDGYHIQALFDTKDNLIPTKFTFNPQKGCKLINQEITQTHYDKVILNNVEHKVLSEILEITITLQCEPTNLPKGQLLNGELFYQTCNDRQCFFPRTLNFSVSY